MNLLLTSIQLSTFLELNKIHLEVDNVTAREHSKGCRTEEGRALNDAAVTESKTTYTQQMTSAHTQQKLARLCCWPSVDKH